VEASSRFAEFGQQDNGMAGMAHVLGMIADGDTLGSLPDFSSLDEKGGTECVL
jgi:hypothetical protein